MFGSSSGCYEDIHGATLIRVLTVGRKETNEIPNDIVWLTSLKSLLLGLERNIFTTQREVNLA